MKKTNITIKKLIILAICALIPLLSGYFIATYAYNRYKPLFFHEYMEKVDESTALRLQAYLKYSTYSYEEEPYYEEVVKKDGVDALKFQIYRAIYASEKLDGNGDITTVYKLTYIFVMYDINYEKLIAIEDPSGTKKLEYNTLPKIYINLQDDHFNGNSQNLTMSVPNETILIKDYNSSPEKDYRGKELNSRYLKWVEVQVDPAYSDEITVEVFMTDSLSEVDQTYKSTILKVSKDDFYQVKDQLDDSNYTLGYNNNIEAAGYLLHVIKTRIWWQSLIAIVLMSFITFSFYIVWNAEDNYKKEKKESKK